MSDKMREEFLEWLQDVHGLESEWQPERNCFKDYAAHLAFQAWQASRSAVVIELPVINDKEWANTHAERSAMRDAIGLCKKRIEAAGVKCK